MFEWRNTALRKVCRSTLQAESLSTLAGYGDGDGIGWILDATFELKTAQQHDGCEKGWWFKFPFTDI